jgi:hypothetical protein
LNLDPQKISVVPLAADGIFDEPVSSAELKKMRRTYRLPGRFLYYPAQLWPHKNHLGLLRALASIRRGEHLEIPLVLTGSRQTGYDAMAREIAAEGLSGQVLFLGAIPFEKVPALYKLSHGVIIPSLYEASSFPILEAFATGTPVIASRIPPVQELIGDEEFLFDPTNEEEMAKKIHRLWLDEAFLENSKNYSVSQRGKYSWSKVAATMIEVYREAAQISSASDHDQATMRKALNARADVIEDLRGRLAETEKALKESERDRLAKEQVIQDLRDASMRQLEALEEAASAAAPKRLEAIQQLGRALSDKPTTHAPKAAVQFIRTIWQRRANRRRTESG